MPHKVFFTPIPSEPYFTYEMHARRAARDRLFCIAHEARSFIRELEVFDSTMKSVLGLPPAYRLFIARPAALLPFLQGLVPQNNRISFTGTKYWERFFELMRSADPDGSWVGASPKTAVTLPVSEVQLVSGTSAPVQPPVSDPHKPRIVIHDLTFSFPFGLSETGNADLILLQVNGAMGVPFPCIVLYLNEQHDSRVRQEAYLSDFSQYELFLLSRVAEDYLEKGMEQIRKETMYKKAVLQHALDNAHGLDLFHPGIKDANVFQFTVSAGKQRYGEIFSDKGLILGDGALFGHDDTLLICNYPTHSKEQTELLADLIAEQ